MTIQAGEKMPSGVFGVMTDAGPGAISTEELFAGKKVVLVSVPGAFTPTCSASHLPGFVNQADELLAKGVDSIACMSVNDVFVMDAWGKVQKAEGKVMMLADGNGDFVKTLGLELDGRGFGMGPRGQRFSMIINDGVIEELNVEEPGAFNVSSAEHALGQL